MYFIYHFGLHVCYRGIPHSFPSVCFYMYSTPWPNWETHCSLIYILYLNIYYKLYYKYIKYIGFLDLCLLPYCLSFWSVLPMWLLILIVSIQTQFNTNFLKWNFLWFPLGTYLIMLLNPLLWENIPWFQLHLLFLLCESLPYFMWMEILCPALYLATCMFSTQ